ncbi:MAG: hypothetical protein ACBR20_12730 [Microcoleus sp.]
MKHSGKKLKEDGRWKSSYSHSFRDRECPKHFGCYYLYLLWVFGENSKLLVIVKGINFNGNSVFIRMSFPELLR